MADTGQRTEKPTQRRLERARKEGNFPSSREFVSSVHFLGFVAIAVWGGGTFLLHTAELMKALLVRAFSGGEISIATVVVLAHQLIAPELTPLIVSGGGLVALMLFAQLATTRMGVSLKKLAPDVQRLNPARKLASLPSQNLFMFAQALAVLIVVAYVVYRETTENLDAFLELPWLAPQTAAIRIGHTLSTLLWRAAGVFLVVGVIDLVWNRRRYNKQLRMSKQEVREEVKEQESSPHVKMRIRRIQRDLARRKMMKEIPNATAVIVNPTHYAVAIRYTVNSPGAPRVIAKGKNYLAARIRQRAIEAEVPIVENPPLARALYSSVDVGQEIPAHLYRAVAEILAYVYKMMGGRLPG